VKRILVTGGAGFIGSHLTEELLRLGNHVTVVDDCSTGSLDNLSDVQQLTNLRFIRGSILNPQLLDELLPITDHVYHLAAAVGVALIAQEQIGTIRNNIEPTNLLLERLSLEINAGRDVKFFLASSSEVYGKNPKDTWDEEDDIVLGATTKPRWSYGASKAIDEFLSLAYWQQKKLPVVVGRFFNVIGLRQTGSYGMVVPRFVDAAVANEPLIVHDDGRQTRCFADVRDIVAAIIELMACPSAEGQVFNIGSDQPISINDLARKIIEVSSSQSPIKYQSYTEAYGLQFEDTRHRVPDLGKLRRTISHAPQFDLDSTLREIVASHGH
jgi:UDP-glucose 4-epimerase